MAFGGDGARSEPPSLDAPQSDVSRLVLEHAPKLRRLIARQFCADPDLVKDLEQEVWLRLLSKMARCPSSDREAAWLSGIARHVCVDAIRERQRRWRLALAVGGLASGETMVSSDSADAPVDERDRKRIATAVAALPPRVRDVVIAHFYRDHAPHEIATEFGMSANAVYKALSVARRLLRPVLAGLAGAQATVEEGRKERRNLDRQVGSAYPWRGGTLRRSAGLWTE